VSADKCLQCVYIMEKQRDSSSLYEIFRLPFGKNYELEQFYSKQRDLLENYEKDSKLIQVISFLI
jgi:hypothetical protein